MSCGWRGGCFYYISETGWKKQWQFFCWAMCLDVLTTRNNKTSTMESRFISIIETEGCMERWTPLPFISHSTPMIFRTKQQTRKMTFNSGYHQNMKANQHPQIDKLEAAPFRHFDSFDWCYLCHCIYWTLSFLLDPVGFHIDMFPLFLPIQQLDCQWMPK